MKAKIQRLINKLITLLEVFPQGFRVKYQKAYFKDWLKKQKSSFVKSSPSTPQNEYDLVFINLEKGWILDGICQEIDRYCDKKTYFHYSVYNIPPAKVYFFAHYSLFSVAILENPQILKKVNLLYYTHTRDIGVSEGEFIYFLNKSTQILTMNCACQNTLIKQGVKSAKVTTVLAGVDEEKFYAKPKNQERQPCIGFCLRYNHQSFYDRKNYDLVVELIKKLDFAKIILLGNGWEQHKEFNSIQSLPYFNYVNVPYDDYPAYYQEMDVFVSVSKLEGGPIPLIESMMCNVFPVVSDTGFAPDIIENGKNGFIFDVDSSAEDIIQLINQALDRNTDVRSTVQHLTWKNFSQQVQALAGLS